MSILKNDFTSAILAVLESTLASYLYDRYDKKANASCFNEVDHSTLTQIQNTLKEEYEKELMHSYVTQNPILPNSRYPFISDKAKSDFITKFYDEHPDLKSVGSEKVSECLGKYIDEINKFLNDILSAEGKFLAKQINDTETSITNEIQNSKKEILSAINEACPPMERKGEAIPSPQPYKIGAKNNLFSGRVQKINDIMLKLKEDKLVFLTGKGGMGKSQIAHEIAFRSQDEYKLIMWFQSNTEAELLNEFNTAAIFYHLITEEKENFNYVASMLSAFIGEFPNSLIVYDNADDISIEFLTSKCLFHGADIIVTTQNSNVDSDEFSVIPIDVFTTKESQSFLLSHSSNRKQADTDITSVPALCNLLENYPLALEYARAYVNRTQSSFEEYMQIYNEHKCDILNTPILKYQKTAYTAWKISYDKIIKQSAAAKNLLCIVSFLDPYDIPLHDIFLLTNQYSSYDLNQIISTIQSYSLFTIHEGLADIHGITQDFIRIQMTEEQEYQEYYEKALKILSELIPDKITDASERDLVNRLIKHAIQLVLNSHDTNNPNLISFAVNIASKLYVLGYYTQTINFIQRLLNQCPSTAQNYDLFQMITFLAQAYHYIGEDYMAISTLDKYSYIVKTSEELAYDPKWSLLSRYKNVEGLILKNQRQLDASLNAFLTALKYLDKLPSVSDHEIRCNLLINIGNIYKHLEQYDNALNYYDHALACSNNEKHLLLRIYGNIATTYNALKQFDLAFQYFKCCLQYSIELGDKRNECISLNHLGNYYIVMQQYDQAETFIKESLKIANEINYHTGISNAHYNLNLISLSREN